MTRTTTADQDAILAERFTKPVYLVDIEIDGQEYLSTNGTMVVDGVTYTGSDPEQSVRISAINNWESATLALPATVARVTQFGAQSWRYGRCRISLRVATYWPILIQPGYVEEGFFIQGDTFADPPMLLIDGEITAGALNGEFIEYTVSHLVTVGRWLPGVRIAPPICNHLPKPGTVIVWEGDRYTLEAR